MNITIKACLLLALSAGLGGCSYLGSFSSSQRMAYSVPIEDVPFPGEDEALIYFVRRGSLELGWALHAVIYDGDDFAGFVPSDKMLPYYTTSGKHLFMVYADAAGAKPVARFIQADLLEGKVYYIIALPSTMSLSGGFSLIPFKQNCFIFQSDSEWIEWIKNAQIVGNTTNAYEWAEQNRSQVLKTKARCLKKWNAKPDEKKPFLGSDDNRDIYHPDPEEW